MKNDRSRGWHDIAARVGLVSTVAAVAALGGSMFAAADDFAASTDAYCNITIDNTAAAIGYLGDGQFATDVEPADILSAKMMQQFPDSDARYRAYGTLMRQEVAQLSKVQNAIEISHRCLEANIDNLQAGVSEGRIDIDVAENSLDLVRKGAIHTGDFLFDVMDRADKQMQAFNAALYGDEALAGSRFDDLMETAGEAYQRYCRSERQMFACSRIFSFRDEDGAIISETDLVFLTELAGFGAMEADSASGRTDAFALNAMETAAGPSMISMPGHRAAGLASSLLLDAYNLTAELSQAQRSLEQTLKQLELTKD